MVPAGTSAALADVVKTKLHIPQVKHHLDRERLYRRLDASLEHKLTVVTAPTGYGKSSVLAAWLLRRDTPRAWLSLGDGDDHPARFWRYVLAAVGTVDAATATEALGLLSAGAGVDTVVDRFLNNLIALPATLLVIDDYHLIGDGDIHRSVTRFVEYLPTSFHLILSSRAEPPLPLGRLRARGDLLEITWDDLAFRPDETRPYLLETMGLELSSADLDRLDAKTEGWIAGLQLAALSLQGSPDPAGAVRDFDGTDRHLLDYLLDEVLSKQPEQVRIFLLRSAVLERLGADLCRAVTGEADARAMLEQLERANLFLIPLDHKRVWYRHHHLWSDLLRAQLERERPGEAAALHQRASRWFAEAGLLEEAVRHALAAPAFELAADLIERQGGTLVWSGRDHALLASWLDALPERLVHDRPRLALDRAWLLIERSPADAERAPALLARAEALLTATAADPDNAASRDATPRNQVMLSEISLMRANRARRRGEVTSAERLAERARAQIAPLDADEPDVRLMWSAVAFFLASAHDARGEVRAAARFYEEVAQQSGLLAEAGHAAQVTRVKRAEVLIVGGALRQARAELESYRGVHPERGPVAGMALINLGEILREQGDLAAAAGHLQRGVDLAAAHPLYRVNALQGLTSLMRVQLAEGDPRAAQRTLRDAEHLGEDRLMPYPTARIAAARVHLWLARGRLAEAARWLETHDPAGADGPYLHELDRVAAARVLLAQQRFSDAAALLTGLTAAAEQGERYGRLVEMLALLTLACDGNGDGDTALTHLARALDLAQPEGYLRVFVDEGRPMASLLARAHRKRIALGYVGRLLRAFPEPEAAGSVSTLLTPRELTVLTLMAEGLTNPEIAERLIRSTGTIKAHAASIYGKLGVKNRTEAVSHARDIGLLG